MTTHYQTGFGNEHASEALQGALPIGQNSPQKVPYGLYAEQLSGTAFTAPRHANRRSWLYRIRPAALHGEFAPFEQTAFHNRFDETPTPPDQMRWSPFALPDVPTDFVDGLFTMAGNGAAASQTGIGIHLYACNRSMQDRFFYDADGELLVVPQQGRLRIATEFGVLEVEPQQVALIPRGVRFKVELPDGSARGYVCENFGAPLRLPELGPIGSNCLANARDFEAPVAAYEDVTATSSWSPSSAAICGRRASTIRRSTWSPGTATTCRTNTICAASTRSARSASIIPIRRSSW